MSVDVRDLRSFYASPLGLVAQRCVARLVQQFWTRLDGLSVLGLGYATPYLDPLRSGCERVLAFMPAAQGVVAWPALDPCASSLADPLMLPLADGCIDRVLIAHALEVVESPADLLHEVSRILTPGGRIVLVTPNRRGLWARMDTTPFGHGQPFSRSQLRNLLRDSQLSPEGWAEALYVPPLRNRLLLQSALAWERLGLGFSLPFAGLHVVEATRLTYRPIAVRQARRKAKALRPVMVPAPASCASPRDAVID